MTTSNKETNEISMIENDIKKHLEIVKLFNSLYKITYSDYYSELIIRDTQRTIIFAKLKNKLRYLEETALENEEKDEPLYVISAFKTLFMKENTFNLDYFDEKKSYFELTLDLLANRRLSKKETQKIQDLTKKIAKSDIGKLTLDMVGEKSENIIFYYCLYFIFKYSGSNEMILNLFIFMLKKKYRINNKGIDFEYEKEYTEEKLEKINRNDLVKDIKLFYDKSMNYVIFSVVRDRLKINPMPTNKVMIRIHENGGDYSKLNKSANNVNNKNIKISINADKEDSKSESNEDKEDESDKKNDEEKNDDISQITPISISQTQTSKQIEFDKNNNSDKTPEQFQKLKDELRAELRIEFEGELEIKKKQIEDKFMKTMKAQENKFEKKMKNQKEKIEEKFSQKYKTLEEENEALKNEKFINNKKHQKAQNALKNIKKNLEDLNDKYLDLEHKLDLILLRDPIKNIFDLFSKALNIPRDWTYINKKDKIKSTVNHKSITNITNNDLFDFLDQIYKEFINSNADAHSLDINQPILSQIFNRIDPHGRLNNLKTVLEKGNINKLLKCLALNRKNNFNNKSKYSEEEKKIFDNVNNINDLLVEAKIKFR